MCKIQMLYVVSYMCTIVGVYSCAVDANQCTRDDGVTTMGLSRGRGSRLRNCGGSHEERSLEREWAETYRCCECRSSLMLGNWARMWRECGAAPAGICRKSACVCEKRGESL